MTTDPRSAPASVRATEVGLVGLASLLVVYALAGWQPLIRLEQGLGWDGVEYAKLWRYLVAGGSEPMLYPYCLRLGTPWLAGMIDPGQVLAGFRQVNLAAAVALPVLAHLIGRAAGFGTAHAAFGAGLALLLLTSPARVTPFYPVLTDPWFLVGLALAVWMLLLRRPMSAFAALAMAMPFRETALYLAPVLLAIGWMLHGMSRRLLLAFAAATLAMLAWRLAVGYALGCGGSSFGTAAHFLKTLLTEPERPVRLLAAISMAAGPVLFAPPPLKGTPLQRAGLLGLAAASGLTALGAGDATRVIVSFLPLYLPAVLDAIRRGGVSYALLCAVGFAMTNRLGQRLLEPLAASPERNEGGLFAQFPDYARLELALAILVVWWALHALHRWMSGKGWARSG